ncbi:OpgC domain-containing protein [Hymenobacter sp. HDW8]|uniref:OpgC domain-containing protein n=1 Tax=Hymenobacter sp. HDW8 TaxID=2714932 RepID=UPI001408B34A|nr:OpgC domain-containing protein [Hymenobacter sp. HDW8]QIL75166.1 succinyl transferase OpgC [Hymenobacter sp. HDW8]
MKRIHSLDFFRGIMLILITVDHFLSEKDIVRHFTYEFIGWVTAAEGFVFLSGLTAGIIYTHKLIKKGERYTNEAAKKRAWLIYRNHIAILLFALIAVLFGYGLNEYWVNHYSLFAENPFLSIFLGATLLYQPIYLDILPMYAVFILFVPVIIKYFQKGIVWQLFACSIGLYMFPIFMGSNILNDITQIRDINTGFFNLLSWQFLFFLGLFSGFSYYYGKTNRWLNNKYLLLFSLILFSGLFLIKNLHVNLDGLDLLFSKNILGPVRLINCLSIVFIIAFVSTKTPRWFSSKPMCYLGRYSLEVYSFHVLLIILLKPLKEAFSDFYSIQITHYFFAYPLALLMILLLIVPALFLAPTLLRKKTYVLRKKEAIPPYEDAELANASLLLEENK